MKNKLVFTLVFLIINFIYSYSQNKTIIIKDNSEGRVFEGIGALSAGASSKLLLDYPVEIRNQILDFLFKPKFGASLQHLKVEIGGDVNSTDGTEPSHAHTRNEFLNPRPEYFQRGYEWLLLKEAKKRNPKIITDCLEWGCPGWIGDGIFYSQDNADYIVSFLKGAKNYHDIDFDFTGIWNERPYNIQWIKQLRVTLDNNGLNDVKIIAADGFDWNIAADMQNDKELNDAVYAISIHYNERWDKDPYSSSEIAKRLNKSIRNSEGGPWKGDWDGFEYLVKLYNRNYIVGKSTNVVTWSLITSYYDNLLFPNSGLMIAKTPWSGHYEVQPGIWAVAHTTQFAEPGWKYIDSGCGFLKKGSYVTLKSPDEKDLSIIIETVDTIGTQTVTFQIDQKFANKTLHVWKSTREKFIFEKQADLAVRNNSFTIQLDGKSAYSITTTNGQTKGNYQIPEYKSFPFPCKIDFENDSIGQLPKYFMDQAGVFEVHKRQDGNGNCLKQVVNQQGIEWDVGRNVFVSTITGDVTWTDYEIHADVNIQENTGYAKLLGRISEVRRGSDYPDGYWFKINTSGHWLICSGDNRIGYGTTSFLPFIWHHLSIKFEGNNIAVMVDNKEVVKVTDSKYQSGLAGLGSDYNVVEFDNFEVK